MYKALTTNFIYFNVHTTVILQKMSEFLGGNHNMEEVLIKAVRKNESGILPSLIHLPGW